MSTDTTTLAEAPPEPTSRIALPPGTRLAPPPGVDRKKIHIGYVITFVSIHALGALIFVPWFFSWTGAVICFAGIIIFGQLAIPIGYHRLLAHRSFRAVKWFEHTLVTLAMCAGQETPARWVAWHRVHHKHSDHQEDPHTPLVSFFWSHMDWLVHESSGNMKTFALYDKYARDILRDPYYLWIEKLPLASGVFFLVHAALFFTISWIASSVAYGFTLEAFRMAMSILIWGVFARTVAVWHITWSVNSLTHLFGYRNFDTPDGSRNNWFVSLITMGEGWHNNHHADQSSATVQIKWWEFDVNFYMIKVFQYLGLVTQITPPRSVRERNSLGRRST